MRNFTRHNLVHARRGAATIFVAVCLIMMLSMMSFAVDSGYMTVVRNELQNAADVAAMAGVQKLLSRELLQGAVIQGTGLANARDQAVKMATFANTGGGVSLESGPQRFKRCRR